MPGAIPERSPAYEKARPGRPADPHRALQLAALLDEVDATGCTLRKAAARVVARQHVAPALVEAKVAEILARPSGGVPELATLRLETHRLWEHARKARKV